MSYEVECRELVKSYGDFLASNHINFGIAPGRLVGILGPSGSGKTTMLRMIAGLETPDSGDILIGRKRVNDVPPGERGIGFVFQNYALFKHMTVAENIAFGMKLKNYDSKTITSRVADMIDLIRLSAQANAYPMKLSGGQRQRVAFARALAPQPDLLLLDEPFAAIDAKVRKDLRQWLRQTISQLGITSIFVTHDQDEAVEVADDIIVMNKGRVEQMGTPTDIYRNPKTPFVAQFIGEHAKVSNVAKFRGFHQEAHANREGIIRPEFIELAKKQSELSMPVSADKGIVRGVYFRGRMLEVEIDVAGELLRGTWSLDKDPLTVGDEVYLCIHYICEFNDDGATILENSARSADNYVII